MGGTYYMSRSRFLNKGAKTSSDYTQSFLNIDTLCTVYSETQKSLGQTPIFKERKSPEDESDSDKVKSESVVEETGKCNNECSTCAKKKYDLALTGQFSEGLYDTDDDDDVVYICEFCNSLGYSKKYRPEICDTCKQCEPCVQYESGECSGCGYSTYRDGQYYRDKLKEEDLFSESDLEVFRSFELDKQGGERLERKPFTITNI